MNINNSNLEFRKIKSLEFLYEVNSNGTILRNVKSKKQIKIKLEYHHSIKGYYVAFVRIKNKTIKVMMHKVVAECWLECRPKGLQIDHINRNSHDNNYHNLRYVSHSEQMKNRALSDKVIEQAKKNCLNWTMNYVAKPVEINNKEESIYFPSMTQCAIYIANKYGLKSEHIRAKLKKRRKHIYDYDIKYLRNVETRRANSKE